MIPSLQELQKRHVIRMAVAYIVTSMLLIKLTVMLSGWLASPSWVSKSVVILAALGLPFALVFSWSYEMTPEGIKHESEVDPHRSPVKFTQRRVDYWTIVALLTFLVLTAVTNFRNWWPEDSAPGARDSTVSPTEDYAAFKREVKALGLDAHWREHGFPPGCRPAGDDDFDCRTP